MYCRFDTQGGNIYYLECPVKTLADAYRHFKAVHGPIPMKRVAPVDIARYVKDLLTNCGPVNRAGIIRDLILQAPPGVDEENAADVADGVIAEMLAANQIELLDDDEYPAYDLV